VTTVAGTGAQGFADGAGGKAQFQGPIAVLVDADGLDVSDYVGNRVRKIAADGTVSTLVGDGTPGATDGATGGRVKSPAGLALGPDGALYLADFGNNAIRRITKDGAITT